MTEGTQTQPAPNTSTEHQKPGDARKPGDTLDKPGAVDRDEGDVTNRSGDDRPADR